MCVCMSAFTHVCMHKGMCVGMWFCIYAACNMYVPMYVCMYACMNVFTQV